VGGLSAPYLQGGTGERPRFGDNEPHARLAELVDATDLKCALSSDVEIVVFPVALILLMITID